MGVDESSVDKQPVSTGPQSLQGGCGAFLWHSSFLGRKGNRPQRHWQRSQGKGRREVPSRWLHGLGDGQQHTVYRMPFYKSTPKGTVLVLTALREVSDTCIKLYPECKLAPGPRHLHWCGIEHKLIFREWCQLKWYLLSTGQDCARCFTDWVTSHPCNHLYGFSITFFIREGNRSTESKTGSRPLRW